MLRRNMKNTDLSLSPDALHFPPNGGQSRFKTSFMAVGTDDGDTKYWRSKVVEGHPYYNMTVDQCCALARRGYAEEVGLFPLPPSVKPGLHYGDLHQTETAIGPTN